MVVHVLRRFTLVGAAAALALLTPSVTASTAEQDSANTPNVRPTEAQDFSDDVPAHISVVHGTATIEHDGKVETAEANMILLAGDRLRTTRGRLEVLYDDGSALHLDEHSTVDLLADSLIRLRAGRLRLLVARTSRPIEYRVDAAPASTLIRAAGEYRISLLDGRAPDAEIRVVVLRGSAELVNEAGRTIVRTGSEVYASAGRSPSSPYPVNSAVADSFERWAQEQIDARLSVESTPHLPEELRYDAGVFDTYGSWGYEGGYGGYVWYPRVAVGWRPYYYGRWTHVGHYGWTWRGYDRWSWATHHYGRWGVNGGRWYWAPDYRWGPAWVAWGYAPGYVGWCPLGYNGRAVFGFTTSVGYYGGVHYSPWSAWTVIPAPRFVPSVVVASHVVQPETITPIVRSQFAEARRAPVAPIAVARAEPLRAPTAPRAVPRNPAASIAAAPAGESTRPAVSRSGVATSTPSWNAPARDAAASRSRAIAPITPEADRVESSRARPVTAGSSWNGNPDSSANETGSANPRAVSRSRVPDDPPDAGQPEPASRTLNSRMPSSRQPEPAGSSRSIGSRWSGSGVQPSPPVESRGTAESGSRTVAPRAFDPGPASPPPSRQAEPRNRSVAPPPASGGGGEPARNSAGSAPSRQPAPAAAPSRGSGGGESQPAPGAAVSRGRGGR